MPVGPFYRRRAEQSPTLNVKASTGRAKCQACNQKIEKDTAQLCVSFRSAFGRKEKHYHLSCMIKEGRNFITQDEASTLFPISSWRDIVR